MTRDDFILGLKSKMKGLDAVLDQEDFENSTDDTLNETDWVFPMTSKFRLYWCSQRCRRHMFFYLLTQQARKFRVDQIHLEQRFDHYKALVDSMDMAFANAQRENPAEFENVQPFMALGAYVSSGFSNDAFGNDTTYDTENSVKIAPLSTD